MSTFGHSFRVSTFGESHCVGVGCIVDGVPPRMRLTCEDVQGQLSRRRPGQSALTTARSEEDRVTILSGVEGGFTLGTPIALLVHNKDQRPGDYSSMGDIPRPSHADFTYQTKYGVRASSGGGRASARETIGRVAAGAIAEKWLSERFGVVITAWVSAVGHVTAPRALERSPPSRAAVDASSVRCPDPEAAQRMTAEIVAAKADEDSVGGVVTCVLSHVPLGLGEPVFDKLEALLAHAMLSIPATKGFEVGSGFEGTQMRGSAHNDAFSHSADPQPLPLPPHSADSIHLQGNYTGRHLSTASNHSGGIQGGITNGADIVFRVAFKPPATIGRAQETLDFSGAKATLTAEGRHDPCVVPRAVPIVEAMAALVLADAAIQQLGRVGASHPSHFPIVGKVSAPSKAQTNGVPSSTPSGTTADGLQPPAQH